MNRKRLLVSSDRRKSGNSQNRSSKKRVRRRSLCREGAVAVEFALVLPLVFLFLFATFEIGRANMIRHAAQAASYEGARVAIIPGSNSGDVRKAVQATMDSVGVTSFQLSLSPTNLTNQTKKVTVSIEVPLDQNLSSAKFINTLSFTGECTLSRELVSDLQ